ncbi:MAG: nucleoside triphosphate pyrophosphatase [Gemmatimonadota bacterium]|jgi:septum formation protein
MTPPAAAAAVTDPPLILASRSPRRAQLLAMLGLRYEAVPADIDETFRPGEEPGAHAERLAREKAAAVAAVRPSAIVVGSDTVVVVEGDLLGKPGDETEAIEMLLRLAGRDHTVATGVAVARNGALLSAVERVRVRFRPFDRATAAAYVATGEPADKAGAYGIQGFGGALVERIDGDFFAVMGLPVCRLILLLAELGFRYDFRGLTPQ